MSGTWVDGHAHFQDCFSLSSYLNAARRNLAKAASTDGIGVLLLAQTNADEHPLAEVQQRIGECKRGWSSETTDPADAIIFCFHEQPSLILIAGRQLVTSERLELLSLCTAEPIAPGQSLEKSMMDTRQANGVPVLPWGFGKWWFERGRILRNLMHSRNEVHGFLLGDNGSRATLFGRPAPLRQGELQRIAVLAGSDPLNIPSHESRACSYGSVLPEEVNLNQPAQWMRDRLSRLTKSPPTFGNCRSVRCFVVDQVRLRMGK